MTEDRGTEVPRAADIPPVCALVQQQLRSLRLRPQHFFFDKGMGQGSSRHSSGAPARIRNRKTLDRTTGLCYIKGGQSDEG